MNRTSFTCMLIGLSIATAGCPRPPDDALEPNNTCETSTELSLDTPLQGRAVQGDPDVFAIVLEPSQLPENGSRELEVRLLSISGTECPAFSLAAPDGTWLYRDTQRFCSRAGSEPEQTAGTSLDIQPEQGFTITAPINQAGVYCLTIEEKGHADNVLDYVWVYEVSARLRPSR